MDIPVQTAIDCDQAFNRLQEAEDCDEICEEADPRGSWAWLVDRVAHGTWVSAYIDPRYQRQLEELADEWLLRLAVRPFARAGESAIELQTPGVRTDLLRRCEEGLSDYRLSEVYHGFDPLSQQGYVELAKEGIFDWRIRASSPSFELRRCLECNSWFIPQRAGRARFCKDRCRSRFNSSRGAEMPSDFDCAACKKKTPREAFSGLHMRYGDQDKPPTDLRMASFLRSFSSGQWCVACVRKKRPQWARYVETIDATRLKVAK